MNKIQLIDKMTLLNKALLIFIFIFINLAIFISFLPTNENSVKNKINIVKVDELIKKDLNIQKQVIDDFDVKERTKLKSKTFKGPDFDTIESESNETSINAQDVFVNEE